MTRCRALRYRSLNVVRDATLCLCTGVIYNRHVEVVYYGAGGGGGVVALPPSFALLLLLNEEILILRPSY